VAGFERKSENERERARARERERERERESERASESESESERERERKMRPQKKTRGVSVAGVRRRGEGRVKSVIEREKKTLWETFGNRKRRSFRQGQNALVTIARNSIACLALAVGCGRRGGDLVGVRFAAMDQLARVVVGVGVPSLVTGENPSTHRNQLQLQRKCQNNKKSNWTNFAI
jgi:hypothetical protein